MTKKQEIRFLPAPGSDEEGTHIALTSGHACRVHAISPVDGKAGTVIPESFRRQAIAIGCGIVGVDEPAAQKPAETQADLIKRAITQVIDEGIQGKLEGDGRPTLKAVSEKAGFNVTKAQFTKVWNKFVAELEEEDEQEFDPAAAGDDE